MVRDRKHTGNNRLKIMLDLRKNKYETSNEEGRRRIVEEVVSSIVDDASSNFLRQVDKKSSGKYEVLSRDVATICVKFALDDDATATTTTAAEATADNMGVDNKLCNSKNPKSKSSCSSSTRRPYWIDWRIIEIERRGVAIIV